MNPSPAGPTQLSPAHVVVDVPTIAAAAARWPRKQLLLWLLAAFTLGTVLCCPPSSWWSRPGSWPRCHTARTPAGLFAFLFTVGGAASALSPSIQVRLMDVAQDSQSIASALNHASLNIGNASGAFFGALAIAAGFGYLSPVSVGLILSVAGVALATVRFAVERRSPAPTPHSHDPHSTTEPIALGR